MQTCRPLRAVIVCLLGCLSLAAEKKAKIDDVLDRLEQRLLEQERETLSFGDAPAPKAKTKAKTSYKYAPSEIAPRAADTNQLQAIGTALKELEGELDSYAGDVQRLKQRILTDASLGNFVAIAATLQSPEQTTIQSLRLSLDGFPIYTVDATIGLWQPRAAIPFYRGPLTAGTHQLQVEARLGRRSAEGLPVDDNTFQSINETFTLKIAGGPQKQSFTLAFKTPERGQSRGVVELGEQKLE